MPVTTPPAVALKEFLGETTRHTRRIEIYESDGATRWAGDTQVRLKDGNVSVDYDRDERRALDLSLDNSDGFLVNAPNQFWYDKIIKVYRGVLVRERGRLPKVLVIADGTGAASQAVAFRNTLVSLGFGDVRINVLAADYYRDVAPYDIIVGLGGATDKSALLTQAYNFGKSVIVMRESALRFYNVIKGNTTWGSAFTANVTVTPRNLSDPRTLGWTSYTVVAETTSYTAPAVANVGFGVAFASTTAAYTISSDQNSAGGKFIAVHYPILAGQYDDAQFRNFLLASLNWINPVRPINSWEVQIGEFMIDRISEPHRPREMKITGRDYAKKLMLSKFPGATSFAAGQSLEALVAAIAGAGGITKRLLPVTGIVVGQQFFFERGKSRWDAIKEICTAYNYEVFFDATGYLVIRPFRDPSTTTPVIYIETGRKGQMASYTKSTSDASLFNHVLVSGESSDAAVVPVYAEARNTNPNSPTRIARIGDRYWEYTSPFITTTAQAQSLANSYLAIHSLEEFELAFDTLMLPWLEVGDIMGWVDPNPAPGDPSTFLLSSLSLPLSLSPMSGVGRRVTIVS